MLLTLKDKPFYGPVHSRRLGHSLGINLFPGKKKVCTFNCLYCHFGFTPSIAAFDWKIAECYPVDFIVEEIEKKIRESNVQPEHLTFSGNGEPTLHPDFPDIVTAIIDLRNRFAPKVKTAILSNSTTVNSPSVREALDRLDVKIMKLDCGNSQLFSLYNMPHQTISLDSIVNGLSHMDNITVQTLITAGKKGNFSAQGIDDWIGILKQIQPRSVQICNLSRTAPSASIRPLTQQELNSLEERLLDEPFTVNFYS